MSRRVTTICGSMRFFDKMLEIAGQLTLEDEIVLAPFVWIKADEQPTSVAKRSLDALHFAKIRMSSSIFVVNVGGYIGESTQREILYAKANDVDVRSLEPLPAPGDDVTRGRCERCGSNRKLRKDGTIPRHYRAHVVCPGAGKPPRKDTAY